MDFLARRKNLPRLWSSLNSDYEVVLNNFMAQGGWTFSHFAKVANQMQITLLYHGSVGQGRKRDDYHKRIGEIILNVPKDLWLHPGKVPEVSAYPFVDKKELPAVEDSGNADTPRASTSSTDGASNIEFTSIDQEDELVGLKYQLGAFYLTYIMYFRQPYTGFLKIIMDPEDFAQLKIFETKIKMLPNKNIPDLYDYIWKRLKIDFAFETHGFSDFFNADASTRAYLNCKNHEMVELVKKDRRAQDCLSHIKIIPIVQKEFTEYLQLKQEFLKQASRAGLSGIVGVPVIMPAIKQERGTGNGTDAACEVYVEKKSCSLAQTLESVKGIGEISETATRLMTMAAKPLFTHSALLGNELTERVFMKEASKCLNRVVTKQKKDSNDVKVPRSSKTKVAKKPYKNESGVFGCVKDDHADEVGGKVPSRMKASFNLWNYIRRKTYLSDPNCESVEGITRNLGAGNVDTEEPAWARDFGAGNLEEPAWARNLGAGYSDTEEPASFSVAQETQDVSPISVAAEAQCGSTCEVMGTEETFTMDLVTQEFTLANGMEFSVEEVNIAGQDIEFIELDD